MIKTINFRSIFVVIVFSFFSIFCGGSQTVSGSVGENEAFSYCDSILFDLHDVSLNEASEEELVNAMNQADGAADRCELILPSTNVFESLFSAHKVRGLRIHGLWFEAALSRRFDGNDGYCAILSDAFDLLALSIWEIDSVLTSSDQVSGSDEIELRELRDLDLEALDVLYMGIESACH